MSSESAFRYAESFALAAMSGALPRLYTKQVPSSDKYLEHMVSFEFGCGYIAPEVSVVMSKSYSILTHARQMADIATECHEFHHVVHSMDDNELHLMLLETDAYTEDQRDMIADEVACRQSGVDPLPVPAACSRAFQTKETV